MTNAKLYVDGIEVGSFEATLPEMPTVASQWELPTRMGPWELTFTMANPKKRRRMWQRVRDMGLNAYNQALIDLYRRVKHHQQRKRLIRKRRHA